MNEEYSNRELDRMFKEIQDTLQRIETQTSRTNGRVTRLEMWRQYILGALAIISMVVIPIVLYLANQIIDVKTSISTQVADAVKSELNKYEVTIEK